MTHKGALEEVTYGLYIISTSWEGKMNGLIVNTVIQVSNLPEKVLVCISKDNLTHDMIQNSKVFTVSILDRETPMKFIGPWGFKSGRDVDKFKDVEYKIGVTGAPIVLEHSLGYMEVQLFGTLDVGSHTIFVGRILESERIKDGEPLTYKYYKEVKGGKASRHAPTFNDFELLAKLEGGKKANALSTRKYKCKVCGWIYDPLVGDPDSDIAPGVPFDDLPDGWTCPLCGVGKDKFAPVD